MPLAARQKRKKLLARLKKLRKQYGLGEFKATSKRMKKLYAKAKKLGIAKKRKVPVPTPSPIPRNIFQINPAKPFQVPPTFTS